MEVCFVTKETLNGVWEKDIKSVSNSNVVVFGFNGLGLVSYKKELAGETEYFQDLANFSKQTSSVVISGADTDNYGVFRQSVVVAEKGKILGVSDMLYTSIEGEYSPGGCFRVYDTSVGRIGVIVGEDLFFTDSTKVLAMCDADLIVCVFKKIETSMPIITLRSQAYCNGVPMAICSNERAVICDAKGSVLLSGGGKVVRTKIKMGKEFSLITSRKRGRYKNYDKIN